jgi:hypothetical protein
VISEFVQTTADTDIVRVPKVAKSHGCPAPEAAMKWTAFISLNEAKLSDAADL